jgi:hypothetical protein
LQRQWPVRGILGVVFGVWELVKEVDEQAVEGWKLEVWMEEGTSEMLYTRDQSHGASRLPGPCGGRDARAASTGRAGTCTIFSSGYRSEELCAPRAVALRPPSAVGGGATRRRGASTICEWGEADSRRHLVPSLPPTPSAPLLHVYSTLSKWPLKTQSLTQLPTLTYSIPSLLSPLTVRGTC